MQERARRPHLRDRRHGRGVLLQLRARRRTSARSSSRASTATTAASRNAAIIVMEKALHGRTLATLSATGSRKVQAGFEPLVHGLRARAAQRPATRCARPPTHNRNVVAVLVEVAPGRRRHQRRAPRVPARPARDLRPSAVAAHDRRGAVRHRAHRQVVRLPARRHPARRDAARQGPRLRRAGRAPAWRRAARRASSSPATTAPPSAAARSRARPALTTLDTIEDERPARERGADGRADPRGLPRRARRRRGRGRDPRHGPDDRHRARPALRRAGEAGAGGGAA